MTRLADALERAQRSVAGQPAAPADPPSAAPVPAVPGPQPPASPAPRQIDGRGGTAGATLLGTPRRANPRRDWRTNPELIGKVVGTPSFSVAALEQYRKLAATLHHAHADRGTRVVMVASCLPGEGKSLTAINLALTLANSYERRALLIDADLRRPTIQRVFGLPELAGLDDGLKAAADTAMTVIEVSPRMYVLPAGRPDHDPLSGLASERMARVVAQAAAQFDWVIIDTPPVSLLPDANLITDLVDGILLVIRSGQAPFSVVKRAADTLGHKRILGVVMNAVDLAHDRNASGYREYYGYGYYDGRS